MYVNSDILTSERILIELLLLKTPPSLQVEFELSNEPKETIEQYFQILEKLITARESAELNTLSPRKKFGEEHKHLYKEMS